MRRTLASAALLAAIAFSSVAPAGAAASPCVDDASLCASTTEDAACVAIGLYTPSFSAARSAASVTKPFAYEHEAVHQVEAGFRTPSQQAPADGEVALHVGAVESWCTTYLFDSTRKSKSCGSGELGEVILDVNRTISDPKVHVRVKAEAITITSCVAAEPNPLVPLIVTHFENLVVEVGGTVIGMPADPAPNTMIPPNATDGFVVFNEQFPSLAGSCSIGAGSAMRIKSGGTEIILGWTSTSACTP